MALGKGNCRNTKQKGITVYSHRVTSLKKEHGELDSRRFSRVLLYINEIKLPNLKNESPELSWLSFGKTVTQLLVLFRFMVSPSSTCNPPFFVHAYIFFFDARRVCGHPITTVYELFLRSRAACFRLKLHSSYARPAPKPAPMKAGQALRRNRMTEKTTPNPRPMLDLTRRFDRQRSHYSQSC